MELYTTKEAGKLLGMSKEAVLAYARALGFKKKHNYYILTQENVDKLKKLQEFLKEL